MGFMKVNVRQEVDGKPGFAADEFEVQIQTEQITVFNRGYEEKEQDIVFVRLSCGATICVVSAYNDFVKKLNVAMATSTVKR